MVIDIKVQTNEINGHVSEDEITELRRQHYINSHNWESRIDRYSNKDPLVDDFCKVLDMNLPQGDWYSKAPYSYIVTFYISEFPFIFEKNNNRFKIMGKNITKKEALVAISKTAMYAGTSKKEGGDIYLFFNKYMETPNLIKRAMDERIEYKFPLTEYNEERIYDYNEGEYKLEMRPNTIYHKVLLNVQKISKKRYAMEISDSMWGEISEKDLLAFIKIFVNGKKNTRSKWWKITPEKLWEYTIGNVPTESQLNTMTQFLLHNRKDKIVVNKSLELVKTLENFKDVKVYRKGDELVVLVRGKEAYWYIGGKIENKINGSLQDVTTLMISTQKDIDEEGHYNPFTRYGGPNICIDNLMGGSSIGDQIYSRAMLCMNDSTSKHMISTMRSKLHDSTGEHLFQIPNFDNIENVWEEE